jgi:hypothetical protein
MRTDDIVADWGNFKLSGSYSLTAADLAVIRWIIREELEKFKDENLLEERSTGE